MSGAEFTPGPWSADDGDSFEPGPVVVAGKTFVCTALLRNRGQKSVNPTDDFTADEAWANAHLIAAAPDLFEATKGLLRFNEELCADVGVSKHYPSAEKARAALAKARRDAQ